MVDQRYQPAFALYPYRRSPDQDRAGPVRHKVIVVGGGPVGLTLALDLGLKGVPVLVLDDHEGPGAGSRAICFAKRTLEIMDRLGCGGPMVEKGVVWNLGKVFRGDRQIYEFNLLPEEGHKRPAFINLQQPLFEKFIVERIREAQGAGAPIEIRGRNRVVKVAPSAGHVALTADTPDGLYDLEADWLVACDGAKSPVRNMMGLGFEGRVFQDNFLIVDVIMEAGLPAVRRFWFDPPFNPGQSALMHKQPGNVWRLDFQLGWDIDREAVTRPENVIPRVKAMLGPDTPFEIEWVSVYTFQCATMDKYRHGRVFFAGDAAHLVSPFGARGCNGGIQDADNLAWKLALAIEVRASEKLLNSYHAERKYAAEENILNSTRSTDFLTPKSAASRMFRDAVLDLAEHADFARALVNSGRLSVPSIYDASPLNGPDSKELPPRTRPGAPLADAPAELGWLNDLTGGRFQILAINAEAEPLAVNGVTAEPLMLSTRDAPLLAERYLGEAGAATYLIRPDQHVAARWLSARPEDIRAAMRTAMEA